MLVKSVFYVTIAWIARAESDENISERTHENASPDGSTFFMGNYGRSSKKEDTIVIEKEWQCFSRFANVKVVDGHPYKHSNITSLAECKQQCLLLQQQAKSCASFVYDNVLQECDIFTQRGDVAPSWYFLFSAHWTNRTSGCSISTRATTLSQISEELAAALKADFTRFRKAKTPLFALAFSIDAKDRNESLDQLVKHATATESTTTCAKCGCGKVSRFTRIEGYEMFESNDEMIDGATVDDCIEQCDVDKIGELPLACRSFDFVRGNCAFSAERAFPVGNGRLKRNKAAAYYEKICLEERLVRNCDRVFDRVPQMVLVGHAETVTDAPTFESCIERCVDSLDVYGYNCTSGMYYFEERQLNCILNAENRMSKGVQFADEYEEIVDYFEISCGEKRTNPQN